MDLTTTVYDLLIFFPDSVEIFDRYNLDYYCKGSQPFIDACKQKNINPKKVLEEIRGTGYSTESVNHTLQDWSPEFLTGIILQYYCDFRARLPDIRQLLEGALGKCVNHEHQKIFLALKCFNDLADAVVRHSISEETNVLKKLGLLPKNKWSAIPLMTMEREHMHIGSLISVLRKVTKNYNATRLSTPTADLTFIMLHQFDKELTQRLHLENNILFPKLRKAAC